MDTYYKLVTGLVMLWLKMFSILYLILFVTVGYSLDIIPERPKVDYFNPKFMREMKIQIRKANRTSPYYIDLFMITLDGAGNNMTVSMKLLEELSGRYQPTPIVADYKLCDFFYKEPYLGQMYAKQLPANWTCPIPAGTHHYKNIVLHLENFPFNIPFTWASYFVNTRIDVRVFRTDDKETIFTFKCYAKIFQKPKKSG